MSESNTELVTAEEIVVGDVIEEWMPSKNAEVVKVRHRLGRVEVTVKATPSVRSYTPDHGVIVRH